LPEIGAGVLPFYITAVLLSAAAFAAGLFTRPAGIVLGGLLSYKLALDQALFSNHEYLLVLWILLLLLGDAGAWGSFDAWRRGARETVLYWPIWLIKVQVSLMYGFTALAKLRSPGFMSGAMLATVLDLPWRLRRPWLMRPLAGAVVGGELALAVALWLPGSRPLAILAGAILHLLFPLLIGSYRWDLLVFGVISVAPYILFLDLRPGSRMVIWDDRRPLCGGLIRVIRTLDWLGVHRFVGSSDHHALIASGLERDQVARAIQLVDGKRCWAGIDALRGIGAALPLTFALAPALGLPGIRALGTRIYRAVAARRHCPVAAVGATSKPR
jgi:predicted DCC family thiol-disulfide oxidoreductase YuxK